MTTIAQHLAHIREILFKPRHLHLPTMHQLRHKAEHFMHMGYLGAVSVEGHGMYALAASGLLVMVAINLFLKD